ncbi:xylulose kinase, putative [Entamoeba nuttalli P19]|uniref:Xylulose kinase, putative n=2 Tax=Entamoeba nuttalli TaxID=412467 RepID=K2HQN5_ENTNP|nr:xylulose kinase, putative [Entamoeba nuttalli P19]EKE38245.1 xylulose kinase, putative [Entamoeba nuttalli P19]|eukprot:XP_008859440.1 xylulose kinase, putative [Entamoeba nuttalli P19]
MKLSIGYDIGSSSIKGSLVDIESGTSLITDYYPKKEMKILSKEDGFAEQNVEEWWKNIQQVTQQIVYFIKEHGLSISNIASIGISYQMHGIVLIDSQGKVLRDAIIWCDSRGVSYGYDAEQKLGHDFCLKHLLNLPGNFTATKLAWIKEHEPEIFNRIYKVLLPGDYIAFRMTGKPTTTQSGLSECMLWDYKRQEISTEMMNWLGLRNDQLGDVVPTFGVQGKLIKEIANELGLVEDIPITYRAGDQPNNAFSLGVLNPGEIVSTAGTSGVVYGITELPLYDELSRINTFIHVNNSQFQPRNGILLCINGTGCLYSFIKKLLDSDYNIMDELAEQVPIGSDGLVILPFGNGSERMLQNSSIGCSIEHLNFNVHTKQHLIRASQEGIVFAFAYGIEQMRNMGMSITTIKACYTNMFQSELFVRTLSAVTNTTIELYQTDGSLGAALASAVGSGYFTSLNQALNSLKMVNKYTITKGESIEYCQAYSNWKQVLNEHLSHNY